MFQNRLSSTSSSTLTPPPSVSIQDQPTTSNAANTPIDIFGNQILNTPFSSNNTNLLSNCTDLILNSEKTKTNASSHLEGSQFKLPVEMASKSRGADSNWTRSMDESVTNTFKSLIGYPKQNGSHVNGSEKGEHESMRLSPFQTNNNTSSNQTSDVNRDSQCDLSFPQTLEELLMKQWDLGAELVMEQSSRTAPLDSNCSFILKSNFSIQFHLTYFIGIKSNGMRFVKILKDVFK